MITNDKKELAIVMGATGNMAFAVANVLIGLKKYSGNLKSDIIIYEQGVSETDKSILKSILPCNFISYKFPNNKLRELNTELYDRFSELTYSRYECFNLLDNYKKVIWLDIDILIQKDISPITSYPNKTGIAFVPEPYPIWSLFKDNFESEYDTNKNFYNAGIFIISDILPNYKKISDWCYKKTVEYAEMLRLVDQSILNLMFQEFNLDIYHIPKKFNCYPIDKNSKEAFILHAYSSEKFWNFWSFSEWNKNYKQWIKMGGSNYKGKKACFISREVKKILPHSPDIIRRPKEFISYIFKNFQIQNKNPEVF